MQEPRYYRLQARYFLQNQWGNAIGLTIAYIFITLLCTIPVIVKISRQMMSGYKRQLFHLDITFLPWILLTILVAIFAPAIILHFIPTSSTLFVQSVAVGIMLIGIVAIIPYIMTANACFYEELRAKRVVQESDNAHQTTDYTTDNTVEEVESEEVKEDEDKQEESK